MEVTVRTRTYSGIYPARTSQTHRTRGTVTVFPVGSTVGLQTILSHGRTLISEYMQLVPIHLINNAIARIDVHLLVLGTVRNGFDGH